jgi:hypothetical protein
MTEIILPPNLPPEVTRDLALALLAAGPGDRVRAAREVVGRHEESVHRAWDGSMGLAMRSLRGTEWTYCDKIRVFALIDRIFGTIPGAILQTVYWARERREARAAERDRHAANFDYSISFRGPNKTRERLYYTPASAAFGRAKRGQL